MSLDHCLPVQDTSIWQWKVILKHLSLPVRVNSRCNTSNRSHCLMRPIHLDWINHLLFNLFNQCKIRYTKRLQDVAKHFNSYEFRVYSVSWFIIIGNIKRQLLKLQKIKNSRNILWIISAITIFFYYFFFLPDLSTLMHWEWGLLSDF